MTKEEFEKAQATAARARASGRHTDGFTLENKGGDIRPYVVYGWGEYEQSSVLAGQARKTFIDSFDTEEQARAVWPELDEGTHIRRAGNTFNHLPGEDDPVSGGMYPDDRDDGI
jgi:hypothetical protein